MLSLHLGQAYFTPQFLPLLFWNIYFKNISFQNEGALEKKEKKIDGEREHSGRNRLLWSVHIIAP